MEIRYATVVEHKATDNIRKGEELFVDYGSNYDFSKKYSNT